MPEGKNDKLMFYICHKIITKINQIILLKITALIIATILQCLYDIDAKNMYAIHCIISLK